MDSKARLVYLLQPVKYKFPRQHVITQGLDDLWDVDLADVSNIGKYNDDIHFLLIVIDVFSKYLWAEPLKTKDHASVIQAFKNIFERTPRRPKLLRSDKGKEFTNRWVKQFLKKEGFTLTPQRMKPKPILLNASFVH